MSRLLRVLIVDDEPQARAGIRALLAPDPEVEVVGEAGSGKKAIAALEREAPDVVFLDVQMPDASGFEVLEALEALDGAAAPIVVFVTAHDEFTLRAFEARALDYLLKPFSDERFRAALERAKKRHRQRRALGLEERLTELLGDLGHGPPPAQAASGNDAAAEDRAESRPLTRFVVRSGREVRYVDCADVAWIEAAEYCVRLHGSGRSVLVRGHLGSFERRLDPRRFVRIHRSTMVNVRCVDRLERASAGGWMAVLEDGTRLKVSKSRQAALEESLARGG